MAVSMERSNQCPREAGMGSLVGQGWLASGTLAAVTALESSMSVVRIGASAADIALGSNPQVAGSCESTWRLALGLGLHAVGTRGCGAVVRSDRAGGSLRWVPGCSRRTKIAAARETGGVVGIVRPLRELLCLVRTMPKVPRSDCYVRMGFACYVGSRGKAWLVVGGPVEIAITPTRPVNWEGIDDARKVGEGILKE